MAKELRRMPFDEFATNLARILDRVVNDNEAVVVEKDDEPVVIVKPARPSKARAFRKKTAEDYEAFLSSAGGWRDLVDTEKLKADITESRKISTRPPLTL